MFLGDFDGNFYSPPMKFTQSKADTLPSQLGALGRDELHTGRGIRRCGASTGSYSSHLADKEIKF